MNDTLYEIEIETFKIKLAVAEPTLTPARCSTDAAEILRPIYARLDCDQEHFGVLLLNNKNRVRAHKIISSGSLTTALVHPREVFRSAVLYGAAAVILCHNHPSGDPAPSPEDIDITRRLVQCADIFGITMLDHIILGSDSIFSFSDLGMMNAQPAVTDRNADRAALGLPAIGSPTGKGGKHRGAYRKRKAKRKDAGIPRGPRAHAAPA